MHIKQSVVLITIYILISLTACVHTKEGDGYNGDTNTVDSYFDEINIGADYDEESHNEDNNTQGSLYSVEIGTIDHSVFSSDDRIIGRFFYEKPAILEANAATKKINDYFNHECDNFLMVRLCFLEKAPFGKCKSILKTGWNDMGKTALPYSLFAIMYYLK